MTFSDALAICSDATVQGHAATVRFDPAARAYYTVVRLAGRTVTFIRRSEWAAHGLSA